VIRLYLGWGRNFLVLLDSDASGRGAKTRYEELFGKLAEGRILTLGDIDADWSSHGSEWLLEEAERLAIQTAIYPSSPSFNKTHFNRAVQELYLKPQAAEVSESTKKRFTKVLDFCESKMAELGA
jgi:hypothetical protein